MNKNILRGLAVGGALIILLVVLYLLYPGRAPHPPPSTVTAPAPPPAAPPEVTQPPAPKVTVFPPEKEKEQYGMLVGSYRKYRDAGKMMQKLQKQGQPAFIRRDKGKYQVWVGPFSTRQEAELVAKSLKTKSKISPKIQKVVIPVPK